MLDPRFSQSTAWSRITTAASAAERLCGVLDPREVLAAIAALVVPTHAEVAIVELLPRSGLPLPAAVAHARADAAERIRAVLGRRRRNARGDAALRHLGDASSIALTARALPIDDPLRALARELRVEELALASLRAEDELLGIVIVARERRALDDRERAALDEIARLGGASLVAARAHRDTLDRLEATATALASSHALLEGSPLPTATFDRELTVVVANDAFGELTRATGDAHGAKYSALDLPGADDLERALRRVLETGTPDDVEVVRGDAPGARRCWLVSCHPVRLGGGPPIGVATSFREISLRAQLLDDATFVADTTLELVRAPTPRLVSRVLANACVQRLGDWCVVHLIESDGLAPVAAVHRDRQRARAIVSLAHALGSGSERRGPHLVARTGSVDVVSQGEVDARADAEPTFAAVLRELGRGPILCVPVVSDRSVVATVTIGRRGSEAAEWSPSELRLMDALVRASAAAFRASAAVARATTLGQLFDDFVRVVAREVRDPLTAIAGRVFLAAQEAGVEAAPHLEAIGATVSRMREAFERLSSAKLPWHHGARERPPVCDAAELAREALGAAEADLRGVAVSTHLARAVRVRCDRDRLRDALVALLRRAAADVPPGGVVCLRVERQHDAIVFSISDTGHGLALEDARRAFDALWNGRDVANVGITLARAVVEAHDGQAWVESVPGSGTAYCLRLPAWDGDHVSSAA